MYFSKKRKFLIVQVIKKSPDLLCRISVDVGWCGLQELAEISGIPLRTIQHYEQRQKDINHARAENLIILSKVLNCKVEDLIEYV